MLMRCLLPFNCEACRNGSEDSVDGTSTRVAMVATVAGLCWHVCCSGRRYVSVALSSGSPPLGVTQHPALCSSDFPRTAPFGLPPAATWTNSPKLVILILNAILAKRIVTHYVDRHKAPDIVPHELTHRRNGAYPGPCWPGRRPLYFFRAARASRPPGSTTPSVPWP